jgi:uncharacterized protein
MNPLRLEADSARRFLRRALLLDAPAPDVATALAHHGYIQIDPINVCGRMHDLILRNRVRDYPEGGLMRHLHGTAATPLRAAQRTALEHHIPSANTLVAFPLEAWPHLQAVMRARTRQTSAWSGRLSPRQKELVPELLAEIAQRGPLSSEDFAGSGRSRHVWGAATQAKATLQKLFCHGRLLIARRGEDNRRYYDLPGRLLPAAVLAQPEPSARETARWDALLKLRQRRLARLKQNELKVVSDLVQAVAITGCPLLHCLRADLPELEKSRAAPDPAAAPPLLLAPLDPLIYDRRVTSALWGYDYIWEVYTPPAKRVRGYYALPVLAGTALVGHVDPKVDRVKMQLRINSRSVRGGHALTPAVRRLAVWLGLK